MRYAYETLLRLYPNSYRAIFGKEMTSVFELATGDYRRHGLATYARFLCTELLGLLTGAFAMWTDEYISRSRRRPCTPFLISLLAGAAITVVFQGGFYLGMGQHKTTHAPAPQTPQTTPDLLLPLVIAGGVLVFISVFSAAFVWNMRIIGNRTGRLKPIWMPGTAASARRRPRNRD